MSVADVQHLLTSSYEFDYPFKFEREFDELNWLDWMSSNWTLCIPISIVYVACIFGLKLYMHNRPRYDLRVYLAAWSGTLAIFSTIAAARMMSEALYRLYVHGWDYTVCFPTIYFGDTAIWAFLFVASKPLELGDTFFIILRKQPLIFLHWYHHLTVMVYSSWTYGYYYAPGRWFAAVNSLVHSIMYTYYFLRAMRVRMHRSVNIFITTTQLLQMIFGMYVMLSAKWLLDAGTPCHVSRESIKYGLLMYTSYFALFANFFYTTYIKPSEKKMSRNSSTNSLDEKSTGTSVHSSGDQQRKSVQNGFQSEPTAPVQNGSHSEQNGDAQSGKKKLL